MTTNSNYWLEDDWRSLNPARWGRGFKDVIPYDIPFEAWGWENHPLPGHCLTFWAESQEWEVVVDGTRIAHGVSADGRDEAWSAWVAYAERSGILLEPPQDFAPDVPDSVSEAFGAAYRARLYHWGGEWVAFDEALDGPWRQVVGSDGHGAWGRLRLFYNPSRYENSILEIEGALLKVCDQHTGSFMDEGLRWLTDYGGLEADAPGVWEWVGRVYYARGDEMGGAAAVSPCIHFAGDWTRLDDYSF